jgi:hypothetical protein
MEVQSVQRRGASSFSDDLETQSTPVDPNGAGRAERASAWDRLAEYLSGDHGSRQDRPAQIQPLSASRPSEQVLPVGHFSPARGLSVDRTGHSVVISGVMELYGPAANPARAASIQQAINTMWTRNFGDGYSIACHVVVRHRAPGSSPGEATQIEAAAGLRPSRISYGLRGRSITLNTNERDAFTWAAAHEFGHIIGLRDRYSESIMSMIRGALGGSRTTVAQPGYEGNLMAETNGTVGRQNVADIAAENEPSSCWIHDDDQVASWIRSHSAAEIGKLSTADKLRSVHVLQGGWISAEDMVAIGHICASVTSHKEAEAIRRGVDLSLFTDLGQRTRMRVFLARMP